MTDRDVYIQARSLILKALDILDRHFGVGKYKGGTVEALAESESVTIAGTMERKKENNADPV